MTIHTIEVNECPVCRKEVTPTLHGFIRAHKDKAGSFCRASNYLTFDLTIVITKTISTPIRKGHR
jgi:hypothetical protein